MASTCCGPSCAIECPYHCPTCSAVPHPIVGTDLEMHGCGWIFVGLGNDATGSDWECAFCSWHCLAEFAQWQAQVTAVSA